MANRPDPFEQTPPPPGRWPKLEQLAAPAHQVLSGFIHGCSKSPADRTTAVTALTLSLWQLAGRKMSAALPSLVTIDADGAACTPGDLLAAHLLTANGTSGPRIHHDGHFMGCTPEQAPVAMAKAILAKRKLGKVTPQNASLHQDLECRYFAAQRTGFGCGPARAYSGAWHDAFDLITDRGDELVLRLDSAGDREAFRRDVIADPDKLRESVGYGSVLELVHKTTSVSGSIPIQKWDAEFAGHMVELGLPILVLPSLAKEALTIDNLPSLEFLAAELPKSFSTPVEEPANFIPEPWFAAYRDGLRRRLRHLPADYEYCIQKLARQVFPVCQRIAGWRGHGAPPREVEALWLELCMHTLRGITLSVAGLAWHVLGFDPGCPRPKALKVLQRLRDEGPMTMSDLLRCNHLKKEERDVLVERFAAEGLVKVDGREVTAAGYREFVTGLYGRGELPQPVDLREQLAQMDAAAG